MGGCLAPSSYPFPHTKPSPFVLGTGSIRGFVLTPNGESLKGFSVKVSNGARFTFTGQPAPHRLVDPEVDDPRSITVLHDFGDGRSVHAERQLRSKPIPVSEADEPDAQARAFKEKYVYLREGEFLLEDVPEGIVTLVASLGGVSSEPVQVTVFPEAVAHMDVELTLPVPVDSGSEPPRFVVPLDHHTLPEIEVVRAADSKSSLPTLSPASVSTRLQAAPGARGTVIAAIEYQGWGEGVGDTGVGWVVRAKIAPVVIPAAHASEPGPVAAIEVPMNDPSLLRLLAGSDDASAPVYPTKVLVRFIDEQGFPVEVSGGQTLEVVLTIRGFRDSSES